VFNFEEVYHELVSAGGARLVGSGPELPDALRDWLADPRAARAAGEAGRNVVESNRGATARTAEVLLGVMAGGE
jgi:3-deoxy-D-manno-octulosonic-acid transferase